MKDIIIYHGSTQIVEYPEIRVAKYNKDFYFGILLHHWPWSRQEDGQRDLQERVSSTSICTDQMKN